ncbi:MAG: hypothetical protein R3F59_01335 [Myxococcota bacterium]
MGESTSTSRPSGWPSAPGAPWRWASPVVALQGMLGRAVTLEHRLRKQTGGPGMYARLVATLAPAEGFGFRWAVTGGAVPAAWAGAIERALREEALAGAGGEVPLLGLDVVVTDGDVHSNDSSERSFALCARQLLREAVAAAGVVVHEPVVRVVAEAPGAPGPLVALLAGRGRVLSVEEAAVAPGGSRAAAAADLRADVGPARRDRRPGDLPARAGGLPPR